MYLRRGWLTLLLVALGATILYLAIYGPPEGTLDFTAGLTNGGASSPGIPVRGPTPPDHPISVRVVSELELEGSERGRRSRTVYRIDFRPPNNLRVRSRGNGENAPDTHQLVFDGRRFALYREGELFSAETVDTDVRLYDALPLPGRHTYALSFLLGDTPYLESPRIRKRDGEEVHSTSRQRVEVSAGGNFRGGVGPTRELQRQYGPYGYEITYGETVTVLPRSRIPPDTAFTVSPRTLASARGRLGARIPDQTFRTLDGAPARVRGVGGPRLINLWATWCPPCIEEIPALNRIQEEYGDRLTVIGISNERVGTIREFKQDHRMAYPVWYSAGELPAPYRNHRGLPTSYLIDEGDRIRRVVSGARSYKQWRDLIDSALVEP